MTDIPNPNHSNNSMISDMLYFMNRNEQENYFVGTDISNKIQEFIHPLGNLEYKIQSVNLCRDHDLWKLLFSLDAEMNTFSEKDISLLYNTTYGENPIYIKFKNQEDESLFLLSFKGYSP